MKLPTLTALVMLALPGAALAQETSPEAGRGLSVVLIVADDMGIGDVGCYGGSIPTPHIDSLARDGARFTQAYVTAPTCGPSRAGLLTGRYQQRIGFEFNTRSANVAANRDRGLPADTPTLADRMRQCGLVTGLVGKWHLGFPEHSRPLVCGFDEFFGFLGGAHPYLPGWPAGNNTPLTRGDERVELKEYLTDAFAREAVAFVRGHAEEPFFLYAAFNAPHRPYQATEEYLERFPDLEGNERVYAAMVSALDDGVGRILASLEETGRADDTLVVFMSDNGAVTGQGRGSNGALRLGKFYLFEGGVRVPLIVRDPRSQARGHVVETPVSSLDLFPTLLAAAGGDPLVHAGLEGRDLRALVAGETAEPIHERLFWRAGSGTAMRYGDIKAIRSGPSSWLFDLAADPGELRDLSEERAPDLSRLLRELADWHTLQASALWPPKQLTKEIVVNGKPYRAEY